MEGETPSKLLRKLPKFTTTVMEGIVRTDSGRWGGRAGRNRERATCQAQSWKRGTDAVGGMEQLRGWTVTGYSPEVQSQILWSLGQFSVSVVYTVEIILEAQNSPRIFIPGVSYLQPHFSEDRLSLSSRDWLATICYEAQAGLRLTDTCLPLL